MTYNEACPGVKKTGGIMNGTKEASPGNPARSTKRSPVQKHGFSMPAMILPLLLFLLLAPPAFSRTFTVASYNVENLFDAVTDGTEYPDYTPGQVYGWNTRMAAIKAKNTARVIRAVNADILCLQEVESERAINNLLAKLSGSPKHYRFHAITSAHTAVQCAVLSVFPISKFEEIATCPGCRPILKATLKIEGLPLVVFVNHWKSKSGPESLRIPYAAALRKAIEKLEHSTDFVITGDFNSNYNEYRTIRSVSRLNDTNGITGINHVLKTLWRGRLVTEDTLLGSNASGKLLLYNLWLELPEYKRWSYSFFGKKESPDAIIIPAALYDNRGISYVDNSFERVMPDFLFKNHHIYRWQRANRGRGKHLGKGYSDHLPIRATFTTEQPAKKPAVMNQ